MQPIWWEKNANKVNTILRKCSKTGKLVGPVKSLLAHWSVCKNGEVYWSETSCMKEFSLWIKQLCDRKVRDFARALRKNSRGFQETGPRTWLTVHWPAIVVLKFPKIEINRGHRENTFQLGWNYFEKLFASNFIKACGTWAKPRNRESELVTAVALYAYSETITELERTRTNQYQDFLVPVFDFVRSVERSVTADQKCTVWSPIWTIASCEATKVWNDFENLLLTAGKTWHSRDHK